VSASENVTNSIPGGIVSDLDTLFVGVVGEPRVLEKTDRKVVLNGRGLQESSITDS